jgi:hypothetical protein
MKKIIYIAETKEFLVDGQVVKTDTLSECELQKLMQQAEQQSMILGTTTTASHSADDQLLV